MNPEQKRILTGILAERRHRADTAAYRARGLIVALGGLFLVYRELVGFSRAEGYVLVGLSILPAIGLLLKSKARAYHIFRYFSVLFDSFLVTFFIFLMAQNSQPEYAAYTYNFALFYLFLASTTFRADPWLPLLNGLGNCIGYVFLLYWFAPSFDTDKFGMNVFRFDMLTYKAAEVKIFYMVLTSVLLAFINSYSLRELVASIRTFIEKSEIDKDLELASTVQRSLFPSNLKAPGINVVPYFETSSVVGGDFYDILEMRDGHRGIFICDVSGHGVASALVSSALKVYIHQPAYSHKIDPMLFLSGIETFMTRQFPSHHLSAQYFYIDPTKKELKFANAGHPYPIMIAQGQPPAFIPVNGSLLGLGIFSSDDQNQVMSYTPGSRLILYTDGLIEAMNNKQELYGFDRLLQIITKNQDAPSHDLIAKVLYDTQKFSNGLLNNDDVSLIVVELT